MGLLRRLLGVVARFGGSRADKPDGAEKGSPADVPQAPGTAAADPGASVEALKEGMQKERELLRTTGTALAVGAGAVLSGLGYARVHDLFPLPKDEGWLKWAALAAAAAALVGAAWLAGRFLGAQRRILVSSTPRDVLGLRGWFTKTVVGASSRDEAAVLAAATGKRRDAFVGPLLRDAALKHRVYAEHAKQESARSLYALDLRARRLERAARRKAVDSPERKALQAEADRLDILTRYALARAAVAILERRSAHAFSGWGTRVAALLAIFGVLGLFGLADYSKGQRDLVDVRSKCAKAEREGAAGACATVAGEAAPAAATPRASLRTILAALDGVIQTQAESILPDASKQLIARVRGCTALLERPGSAAPKSTTIKDSAIAACAGLPPPSPQAAAPASVSRRSE